MESSVDDAPGLALSRMLSGYSLFMENVFSLLRFVEGEMTKRGWEIVRNGGYGITRNGYGRGLSNFATADWVLTQAGIAFVKQGSGKVFQGVSTTEIPSTGLRLVTFQVWWDETQEPVIWRADLLVRPDGEHQARKWEDYQSLLFKNIDSDWSDDATRTATIHGDRLVISGSPVIYTGRYVEIPVTEVTSSEAALNQLITDLPPP